MNAIENSINSTTAPFTMVYAAKSSETGKGVSSYILAKHPLAGLWENSTREHFSVDVINRDNARRTFKVSRVLRVKDANGVAVDIRALLREDEA